MFRAGRCADKRLVAAAAVTMKELEEDEEDGMADGLWDWAGALSLGKNFMNTRWGAVVSTSSSKAASRGYSSSHVAVKTMNTKVRKKFTKKICFSVKKDGVGS